MPLVERVTSHQGNVGGLPIARALPSAHRRMVGAWCFLDHAGPAELAPGEGMRVGPHPHTGLQTFSWMIDGEILHRDSLGSEQMLRPGQVNLMTAGRGISHSEESQTNRLHLAQLWIALPDSARHGPPAFEHFPTLPRLNLDGFEATLLTGDYGGARSPVPSHTPLLGMDIASSGPAETRLSLDPAFEHGLMVLEGEVELAPEGHDEIERLSPGSLLYLAPGFDAVALRCAAGARLMLLGGPPFPEPVLLWWNFVGRDGEEIKRYAAEWNAGTGPFGEVHGFDGPRLVAPDPSGLRMRAS